MPPREPAGAPGEEGELRSAAIGEPDADAPAEPSVADDADRVERDLDELVQAKQERDTYLELAQRTQADFENYRRRVAREGEEAERRIKAKLAGELIPVLDNLERALRAAGVDPSAADTEAGLRDEENGGLLKGVLLTYRDLEATLSRAGVEAYHPAGERFDPNWHEALTTRAEDGTEGGVILEVVEKGYRLDGQVLRAARVVVSA